MIRARPNDLISKQEIAQMAGVGGSAINQWQNRTYLEFPEPWGKWPGRISLWLRSDIENWFALREAQEEQNKQNKIDALREQLRKLEAEDV